VEVGLGHQILRVAYTQKSLIGLYLCRPLPVMKPIKKVFGNSTQALSVS
jgi:hypothetical protein